MICYFYWIILFNEECLCMHVLGYRGGREGGAQGGGVGEMGHI